jgi:hypothetical protein
MNTFNRASVTAVPVFFHEAIKRKLIALTFYFGEQCNHWFDYDHFQKLHEINPELAENYERSMFDLEFILRQTEGGKKIKANIKCHPYHYSSVLYICKNEFVETTKYVQSRLDQEVDLKGNISLDSGFLDIFDLPEES